MVPKANSYHQYCFPIKGHVVELPAACDQDHSCFIEQREPACQLVPLSWFGRCTLTVFRCSTCFSRGYMVFIRFGNFCHFFHTFFFLFFSLPYLGNSSYISISLPDVLQLTEAFFSLLSLCLILHNFYCCVVFSTVIFFFCVIYYVINPIQCNFFFYLRHCIFCISSGLICIFKINLLYLYLTCCHSSICSNLRNTVVITLLMSLLTNSNIFVNSGSILVGYSSTMGHNFLLLCIP